MPTLARGLNIVALHEAIAEAVPDRECIVWRDRRLTWDVVTQRTRQLANGLLDRGIGGAPRRVEHRWESPHDHVALYLTNGNEYLEAMLASWKAGAAPINVNYRYTAGELGHLLRDSAAVVVVYHARFAPTLAETLPDCPDVVLLVVVDDGSGTEPVPGSVDYEHLIAASPGGRPHLAWSGDDRYLVYTGGTTGTPKGVIWRQDDFLASALNITSAVAEVVERARRPDRPRALPAPPFMHGAAHWNAISCWVSGGTVIIQDDADRLEAADVLDTCARESVDSLLIVGDAFARPLLDEQRTRPRELSSLRILMTGGAILSPARKQQFLELLPHLRIVDILGSSETGRHGLNTTSADTNADAGVFHPSPATLVLDDDKQRPLEPGEDAIGWLAQRGRVPLGYLGDPDRTDTTFPLVGDEVHAIAGDRARVLADGRIALLGRDSITINTGGEKVHAEEVEQVLKADPSVDDVLVVGRRSERWGQEVVAVVAGAPGLDTDRLHRAAAEHLARYKLPKDYLVVDSVRRSASGKPDYAWARVVAGAG